MTVQRLRTRDQVLATLNAYFDSNVPNALRIEGTVPQDQIDTNSIEYANLYNLMTMVKEMGTVAGLRRLIATDSDSVAFRADLATAMDMTDDEVNAFISSAVDDKVADEDITRKAATKATLILRFMTPSSFNASIPVGTAARTQGLNSIEYKTTVNILNQPVTLDTVTGLYYIDVAAEATLAETASRVPLNRVTSLTPPLTGFSAVTNVSSSSGGTDTESDSDLLDRYMLAKKSLQLDTIGGLTTLALDQTGVTDALVVDNSDPLMTRGVGSQVDIWIMGDNDTSAQDTITYNSEMMNNEIIIAKQPVQAITFVSVAGNPYTENIHFTFVKDNSGYANSSKGNDKIVFTAGNEPLDGQSVIIQYTYNKLITDVQSVLAEAENKIPNSDILVREAYEVLVDMSIHLTVYTNYSVTDVNASVTTNLTNTYNAKKLANSVYQSDLVNVIENTDGVNRVDLPFALMARTGSVGTSDIITAKNEYARLNSLNFV